MKISVGKIISVPASALVLIAALWLMAGEHICLAEQEKPKAPVFSAPGGFYDREFELELSSPDGCEVLYTLDCTSPARDTGYFTYALPIRIFDNSPEANRSSAVRDISLNGYRPPASPVEKAMVVRAVCRDERGVCSDEVIMTYFVGKNKAYYEDMLVISMVMDPSDLFGTVSGVYMVGDGYYRWKESDEAETYEHPADPRYPTNYNRRGRASEKPCHVEVFRHRQEILTQRTAMRISGNFSRADPQKSITLCARKEYGKGKMHADFFDGSCIDLNGEPITAFDKVTLRNGGNDYSYARFRDDLNALLMRGLNLSVLAKQNTILYLNGEFWGFYSMQEKPEDHYLAAHYGVDADNVTVIKCGEYEGSAEVFDEYREFYDWMLDADLSDPENMKKVDSVLDLDGLIDLFAAQSYICNWDFGVNINNWMMWRVNEPDGTPCGDGKWRFIVYDTDYSLGLYENAETACDYDYLYNLDLSEEDLALPVLLFDLVMGNEDFCARFRERYTGLVNTVFLPENVLPLIDRFADEQMEAFYDTAERFGIWHDYPQEVTRIREFFEQRGEYALSYLEEFCGE